MSNSGACLNSGEFSGEFPTFRLLVVDDEIHYLKILEQMLKKCQYEVTTCNRGEDALSLLRANKNNFHLVIIDVHMPDMDSIELLKQITLEMNLPVVMMSADDSRRLVLKCVVHGARDYLIKPVRVESLQNIWQHIVRHNKDKILNQYSGNVEQVKEVEYSRVTNEGRLKKARTVWSPELRRKFVQAVNHLGIDRAVPKKILELMNVPGLKREHVASHLQKHRLLLRKHQNGLNNAFMGHSEANIETLSNRLPALNVGTCGRPTTKSSMSVLLDEQIHHYNFENPMSRYQNQLQMNECNKQVNLLYGIPITVEQNPSFLGMNTPVGRISQPQLQVQNMLSQSNNVLPQNGINHSVPQVTKEDVDYIFDELYQQNVGSTFDTSYHSSIHHGIFSMEQSGQSVNVPIADAVLSNGQEIGHVNPIGVLHVNDERYPGSSYESTIFTETFGQEDLFLEQQQQ